MIAPVPQQDTCKACGKPLEQAVKRGPRKREFCNATCRQRWHRRKDKPPSEDVTIVTMNAQARIAELEEELATAHALIDAYLHRRRTPSGWKNILQKRFWHLGQGADWPALSIQVPLAAGERAYRVFGLSASNELLEWASIALRNRHQS